MKNIGEMVRDGRLEELVGKCKQIVESYRL